MKLPFRPFDHAWLLCTCTMLFWSGNATIARGIHEAASPIGLAFYRWSLALLILLPFSWRLVRRDWPALKGKWWQLTLLAFLGISCFNTLLYFAAKTTTAVNITLMQTAMPAMIVLISAALFRDHVSPRQALAMVLCFGGAVVIVAKGSLDVLLSAAFTEGDLLMAGAAVVYALYSALVRLRPDVHPLSFLTALLGLGVALLAPLFVWETTQPQFVMLDLDLLPPVVYFAIFPSILAYLFWNRGIELVGANGASLYLNLLPVFGSILGATFLGERVALYHGAGLVLIAGGITLFNIGKRRVVRL